MMVGDRSTEGTESEAGSKKKERKNTIKTHPMEATSQSLLAHFLHRSRELNLGINIEGDDTAKRSDQLVHSNTVFKMFN